MRLVSSLFLKRNQKGHRSPFSGVPRPLNRPAGVPDLQRWSLHVDPGVINPGLINRGVPLLVGIHHFWREHPRNNGTGLFILGKHYSPSRCWRGFAYKKEETPLQFDVEPNNRQFMSKLLLVNESPAVQDSMCIYIYMDRPLPMNYLYFFLHRMTAKTLCVSIDIATAPKR